MLRYNRSRKTQKLKNSKTHKLKYNGIQFQGNRKKMAEKMG